MPGDVMAEVIDRGARSGDEDFRDTLQSIADVAEEFMPRAHVAVMLRRLVRVRLHFLREDLIRIELMHLGKLVVGTNHCMVKAHRALPFIKAFNSKTTT